MQIPKFNLLFLSLKIYHFQNSNMNPT